MIPVNTVCASSLRRTMGRRMMSTHHHKPAVAVPQDVFTNGPRLRAEDILSDSSKFLTSSESNTFTSTMPVETLIQVITEQELAAAKKVVRK
ncbi:unnamed protein product [Absidia cylindrospora]